MSWRENGLPIDFVDGEAKTTGKFKSEKPTTVEAMERRIIQMVCARDGFLEDVNFTFGWFSSSMYLRFSQALSVASPLVRKAVIHFSALDATSNKLMADFLEQSPLLSGIHLDGNHVHMGFDNLAVILDGLSRNPSGKLRRIIFSRIGSMAMSEESKATLISALRRMSPLRDFEIFKCDGEVVDLFCQGLMGHDGLECMTLTGSFDSSDRNALFASFLASLPNLKSFESFSHSEQLLNEISRSVSKVSRLCFDNPRPHAGAHVSNVLQGAPKLEDLDLRYFNPSGQDVGFVEFNAALGQLTCLESLNLGIAQVESLLQCTKLKHLTCLSGLQSSSQGAGLSTLLQHLTTLESLEIGAWLDDSGMHELLQLLETNSNIKSLSIYQRATTQETADQFRRTLAANCCLQELSMNGTRSFIPVIVDALESDSTTIKSLCIKNIEGDPSMLFRSMVANQTITSLSLKNCRLSKDSWPLFLEMIASNTCLTELNLRLSGHTNIDEFATALEKNSTLTTITVDQYDTKQPQWTFVSRLFSRRNLVRQMIKQGQLPPPLLPQLLQTLSPNYSSVFLAMSYVPWPLLSAGA